MTSGVAVADDDVASVDVVDDADAGDGVVVVVIAVIVGDDEAAVVAVVEIAFEFVAAKYSVAEQRH